MRDIVITRDLPYPVELVWSAFTESDQIAAWLMKNDFSPVVGFVHPLGLQVSRLAGVGKQTAGSTLRAP